MLLAGLTEVSELIPFSRLCIHITDVYLRVSRGLPANVCRPYEAAGDDECRVRYGSAPVGTLCEGPEKFPSSMVQRARQCNDCLGSAGHAGRSRQAQTRKPYNMPSGYCAPAEPSQDDNDDRRRRQRWTTGPSPSDLGIMLYFSHVPFPANFQRHRLP